MPSGGIDAARNFRGCCKSLPTLTPLTTPKMVRSGRLGRDQRAPAATPRLSYCCTPARVLGSGRVADHGA